MATNSNFNFITDTTVTLELPFSEHIEELRQRLFLLFWVILILTLTAFIEVKDLVKILELPIQNVKFFQISPGEYFISRGRSKRNHSRRRPRFRAGWRRRSVIVRWFRYQRR